MQNKQPGGIKIFVIEDHVLVREGMVSLLRLEPDFDIIGEATDSAQAEKYILEGKPDVLLTDISMPTCPFEMVRRCVRALPEMRVVFITAFSSDVNLERALGTGSASVVSKGTDSKSLCTAIRESYRGQTFFSEDIRARVDEIKNFIIGSERDGVHARHRFLSPREFEVLRCVARGMSAKSIASELRISVKTVDRHKSNIMTKLGMHSQVDLTRYAIREGLIAP